MTRVAILVVLAAGLAAPAPAFGQWSTPDSLTGDVGAVFRPQAMTTGRGDRVVGYGESGRFAWSWAPRAGATWFQRTTTTTDVAARLLTYASTRVLLVSRTSGRLPWEVRARFGSVDEGVGKVRRLAPGQDVLSYAPAVDGDGDAVVAYVRNVRDGAVIRKRVVNVVRRPAGGSFGAPETIAGSGSPTAVGAAVGRRGEIVVAYERAGRLLVRRRESGRSWQPAQNLGPAVKGHTQIDIAAAEDGAFALAWQAQDLSEGGSNGTFAVRLAVRDTGGHNFHTARTFETYSQRAPQEAAVRVALAADGSGVMGWTGRQDGHFVVRIADVHENTGHTVSDPASDAVLGDVSVSEGGDGVAVWAPPLDTASPQVFAATRSREGAFGPPEAVSPAYREIASPTVATDRDGHPFAAWVARTGARTQGVFASFRGGS